ncbi:hypothetical protein GCM10023347_33610 [Streptomyces chumphonensis]
MPIPRTVLSNIENGRRTNVSVAEVLMLAHALEVAPGALIYPAGYVEEVEVVPGVHAHPVHGIQWISGEIPLPSIRMSTVAAIMKTALFYMRQLLQAKDRMKRTEVEGYELQRRAVEADDPAISASFRSAAEQHFQSRREGEEHTKGWVETLRAGFPGLLPQPIPFPDVHPYPENVTIEMMSDPYRTLVGLEQWGEILAKRDDKHSQTDG